MNTSTPTDEARALLANDIRVLVGQLNDAIKAASEKGLRIDVNSREVLDFAAVCKRAEIMVRIFAEVQ